MDSENVQLAALLVKSAQTAHEIYNTSLDDEVRGKALQVALGLLEQAASLVGRKPESTSTG